MPNSSCYEETCLCIPGYHSVNQSKGCLLRQIGDNCRINEDCFQAVDFSHCDVITSTCACNSGRHTLHDDNTHCALRKIGDKCNVDSDCINAVSDSYCDVISCQCKSGYYVTRNGTTCTRRRISDECYLETDCSDAVTNSYCHREPQEITTTITTVSSEDFVSNTSTVIFTHHNRTNQEMFSQSNFSLNETSWNDTNNLINSHLNYNQSERNNFSHLVMDDAKRSMKNIAFEGYPHNVSRTLQNVDVAGNMTGEKRSMVNAAENGSKRGNSTSTSSVAEIIMETLYSESSPAAETTVNPTGVFKPGDYVTPHANDTLTINNTTKAGYIATTDPTEVDETTGSGRSISDGNYTLTRNSTVSGYIATNSELTANSTFSNETLTPYEFLNETEADSVTMTTMNLDLPGYCTCKSGYKIGYNKSTCIKRIIGDTCSVQSDCLDVINNSTCLNITFWGNNLQICACDIGLKEAVNGSTCVPRLIGEHCLNSLDCTSVGNSTCGSNSRLCECDVAFYPSEDNTTCVLRKVGDSCESDTLCSTAVNNSFCSSNKSCDRNTNCSVSQDCDETRRAESCSNPRKVCTCVLGYLPKQNSSTCVKSESRCPHSRVLFEV